MSKRFRVCDLNQPFLLPPSLQEWLPQRHLARFLADVTDELDLSPILAAYERSDGRGLSAYHPLLLTRLLLYGYSMGVTSSRAIEKATYENIAFRFLAADQHPDHDTVANFRHEHLEALAGLFVQVLRLCEKAGLVKLGHIAIDGTKMLANASTHRSLPYKKLREREQYWESVVQALLAQAEKTDQREDEQFGKGRSGDALPEELAHAQSRIERIRRAKAELEQEARRELEAAEAHVPRKPGRPRKSEHDQSPEQSGQQKKRRQRARRNAAEPTRQYNFSDPDSRVMHDNARKCFVQAYNAQIAVDAAQQVIVAAEVTQQTTDRNQLVPMMKSVRSAVSRRPETAILDAGYWNSASLHDPSLEGTQVLVSPDSQIGTALSANAPRTTEAVSMRERLRTPAGKALYLLRKATVEPVFGQIKEVRGLRRFRFRGFTRVACEWKLICATHNLLKLFRHASPLPSST